MNKQTEEIIIEVSQEEYQADLAHGFHDDEVLPPGQHRFRRGGFLKRHGIDPEQCADVMQMATTIELDADILAYFQEHADPTDSVSLQTQINDTLRQYIEAGHSRAARLNALNQVQLYEGLIEDLGLTQGDLVIFARNDSGHWEVHSGSALAEELQRVTGNETR